MAKISASLLKALAVTAEAIGVNLTDERAKVLVCELEQYPEERVLKALAKCKMECRGFLSLADVIDRIDDGHPSPEEAWAIVPKSEADSAAITDEIAQIPTDLMAAGEIVAARMAFKETYARLLAEARAGRRDPRWWPSLGHDTSLREAALHKAVTLGRISQTQAAKFLPAPITDPTVARIAETAADKFKPDFAALRAKVDRDLSAEYAKRLLAKLDPRYFSTEPRDGPAHPPEVAEKVAAIDGARRKWADEGLLKMPPNRTLQ